MPQRYSKPAREVLTRAHREVRDLNHECLGTEHILIGLIGEEAGLAAKVLLALDLTADGIRQRVVEIVGEGRARGSRHIPLTPDAQRVLTVGSGLAEAAGDSMISTHHLLLALLDESESVGVRVLCDLGAQRERLRTRVFEAGATAAEEPQAPAEAKSPLVEDGEHNPDAAAQVFGDDRCSFCGRSAPFIFGYGEPGAPEASICEDCIDLFHVCLVQVREHEPDFSSR